MSIKSQKVLHEELFELWEKSYSVNSVSDDEDNISQSSESVTGSLSTTLLRALRPPSLAVLKGHFLSQRDQSKLQGKVESAMRSAAAAEGIEFATRAPSNGDKLWIDERRFVDAIKEIFGGNKYTPHAYQLFQQLDPFHTGQACWSRLLDSMLEVGARRCRGRGEMWEGVREEGMKVKRLLHCQRETIVKLVPIRAATTFCYAALSRGGHVGLYSGDLLLKHQYNVWAHRKDVRRRIKNCWVTDAVYMPDVQCLAVTSSDRSITVLDASTLSHTPLYCITSLPHIPTCLCYVGSAGGSVLAVGGARGHVTLIHFLQPARALFHKEMSDSVNTYYWTELYSSPHTAYCHISTRLCHPRAAVLRILALGQGEVSTWGEVPPESEFSTSIRRPLQYPAIVSCCSASRVTVRWFRTTDTLRDYICHIERGVSCMSWSPTLSLLAVGSRAGRVTLLPTRATIPPRTALPTSRRAPVVDVALVGGMQLVVALCEGATLDIWDVYEETHLQRLELKFPFLGVLGRKAEFGPYSIHPGPVYKTPAKDPKQKSSTVTKDSLPILVTSSPCSSPCSSGSEQDIYKEEEPYTSEIIISCSDYVCHVSLMSRSVLARPLSPPRDVLAPKTPAHWSTDSLLPFHFDLQRNTPKPSPHNPELLSSEVEHHETITEPVHHHTFRDTDLEELLEKADLQGLLEKDFVLKANMKHDLNKKIAKLQSNMDHMHHYTSLCAPHLAIPVSSAEGPIPAPCLSDTATHSPPYSAAFSNTPTASTR